MCEKSLTLEDLPIDIRIVYLRSANTKQTNKEIIEQIMIEYRHPNANIKNQEWLANVDNMKKLLRIIKQDEYKKHTILINGRRYLKHDLDYGGVATQIEKLPIGREFYVRNGDWSGRIIQKDGEKIIEVLNEKFTLPINPNMVLYLRQIYH